MPLLKHLWLILVIQIWQDTTARNIEAEVQVLWKSAAVITNFEDCNPMFSLLAIESETTKISIYVLGTTSDIMYFFVHDVDTVLYYNVLKRFIARPSIINVCY